MNLRDRCYRAIKNNTSIVASPKEVLQLMDSLVIAKEALSKISANGRMTAISDFDAKDALSRIHFLDQPPSKPDTERQWVDPKPI